MKNEIELLNQTEEDLLMLMKQYKSGQYSHLADCITRVRTVRETLRLLTPRSPDSLKAGDSCLPDVVLVENALPAVSG